MLGWFLGLGMLGRVLVGLGAIFAIGSVGSAFESPTNPEPKQPGVTQGEVEEKKPIKTELKDAKATIPVPFQTVNKNDPNLDSGKTYVSVQGVNGVRTVLYKVTLINGKETSRQKISDSITQQPVNKVVNVGTYVKPKVSANCDSNYSPCVPNVSYDLDCPDIGFSVTVIGYDVHNFDRDSDGYGCESY